MDTGISYLKTPQSPSYPSPSSLRKNTCGLVQIQTKLFWVKDADLLFPTVLEAWGGLSPLPYTFLGTSIWELVDTK